MPDLEQALLDLARQLELMARLEDEVAVAADVAEGAVLVGEVGGEDLLVPRQVALGQDQRGGHRQAETDDQDRTKSGRDSHGGLLRFESRSAVARPGSDEAVFSKCSMAKLSAS